MSPYGVPVILNGMQGDIITEGISVLVHRVVCTLYDMYPVCDKNDHIVI